jgi:cell division protease FtsH
MSLAAQDPKLPVPQGPRYSWQTEETLVERRKRLPYRIWRFVKSIWLWVVIVGIIVAALFDVAVMTTVLGALSGLLRIAFAITFVLIQFIAIFWFLGRVRKYTVWPGAEGISFADYRGQPEILDQAKQIVKLLRGVKAFENAGGEPLNGLLLEGPPGTGKTWLAQAISTEANVPFFYIDATSLNSMFMGIGPMKVSGLYRQARRAAREYGASVIFIDEIDAIGSRGGVTTSDDQEGFSDANHLPMMFGAGMGMGGSPMLNTLLTEMSGFSLEHGWWARKKRAFYKTFLRRNPPKPEKRVLTIGATNRMGALDPALLRPGRFDKKIRIDPPDLQGRRDIIAYYMSKMAHDDSIDPLILATETPGYTPADLKYLLNESLRYALFAGRTYMTVADVRGAQPEHEMGLRTPIKNLTKEDEYRLAAHEAGHAVAVRLYLPHFRIARITIIRQGGALGYVLPYPASEQYDYIDTFEMLMNRLRVSVAGKAGEIEFCGEGAQTLGVGGDFANIRYRLMLMANAGMFGPLGAMLNGTNYPPEIRDAMDETFRMALDEVRMALRIHHEMTEALIQLLLQKKELMADVVEAFFDQYGFYTPKVTLRPDTKQLEAEKGE